MYRENHFPSWRGEVNIYVVFSISLILNVHIGMKQGISINLIQRL